MRCIATVLLCCGLLVTVVSLARYPTVNTTLGRIQGTTMVSRKGAIFFAFRGIPYAEPPLARLRFRSPRPVGPWNSVLKAVKDKPSCVQLDWILETNPQPQGSEDCLYLNVYTPKLPQNDVRFLDVFVYIHGGSWSVGSGSSTSYGPQYFLDRDVVLVTIQYRLGALGFLSTEDRASPGNYGMKDQVAALRWVRDNIEAFGGNPERVTIFGQSAGGASVHLHLLSPLSNGLFHRAIMQSGTALTSWAPQTWPNREYAMTQGALVGCHTNNSFSLVECLRTKDAEDIVASYARLQVWDIDPETIFVVVPESPGEEAFLPEEPYEILRQGNYSRVPLMAGVVAQEGCFRTAILWRSPERIEELDRHWDHLAPLTLRYQGITRDEPSVNRRVREFYFGDRSIGTETERSLTKMYGDRGYYTDPIESLNIMSAHNLAPLYLYRFSYRGRYSYSQPFSKSNYNFGVCHSDDNLYLFRAPSLFPPIERGSEDDRMIDVMLDIFTTFGRTGKALLPDGGAEWPEYSAEGGCHLDIGAKRRVRCGGLYDQRVAFWSSLCLMENGNRRRCS